MIKCVIPVSGGKDSQACLKLALREFDRNEILGLFCDTHFEHPSTYLHIAAMRLMYGVSIHSITAGSVPDRVRRWGRFPSGVARFCTDELKIAPSKKFYKQLAEEQGGFQVWYGMRSDESNDRKLRYAGKIDLELYEPHEVLKKYPKYLSKLGVKFRLPVLDWTKYEILQSLEGEHNPLYDHGFDRVGCFPCLAGGDAWKEKAFAFDSFGENQRVISIKLAEEIRKPLFNSKGGRKRNLDSFQGCALCSI